MLSVVNGDGTKITDDEAELLAFYDFPAERWIHPRTTNLKVTRGAGSRTAALIRRTAMVFKLVESAQERWRAVNAPHLVALVGGREVTLRCEGQLLHVITGGHVIQTFPAPIPSEDRAEISGAHAPRTAAPPPPAPPLRAHRRVASNDRLMIAGQTLAVGARHLGKIVTVQIEDALFRVLDGAVELAAFSRDPDKPIRQFRANVKTTL